MKRLKRDMRLKFLFARESMDSNAEYLQHKKLYIKSNWDPPTAFKSVENRLSNLESTLTTKHLFKQHIAGK